MNGAEYAQCSSIQPDRHFHGVSGLTLSGCEQSEEVELEEEQDEDDD